MLDISRLRLLRTVIATGSLRASAETLGYTPSAASQQLAALQRQTGLRLVEKSGRGIEPTAAGRALAAESSGLFEELSRLDGVVGDLRAGRVGTLSIGYVASVGATWLPPIVDGLRSEFPELRLELRMADVSAGPRDIDVFVEDAETTPSAAVRISRLVADPYVLAVRADDPLASRPEVPLSELADRAWIDNEPVDGPCRRILLDACAQAGITPRFQVQTPDYRTALPMVATGIGITVLPRLAARDLPAGVTARPLTAPTPIRFVSIAVRRSIAENPAVRRTVELLLSIARQGIPVD
ncbi:DNA-binding transcriptional LysR family regulator [Nocardia transvalensis]|uniref:DNA-binding transcriptional LysR family regulator n=1 Tax=Nocardia transvalensis TaxID=37333 RepID=A0A7W9PIU4_9NOCA|nr:LysR family transcriptional regulator [Nocardia transvalensis]MBB5916394.1 DNA-binding transcriptional LysR family regulator [Nocardia transvalensis]